MNDPSIPVLWDTRSKIEKKLFTVSKDLWQDSLSSQNLADVVMDMEVAPFQFKFWKVSIIMYV